MTRFPGKIQLGSAWWFCDTDDGMYQQMKTLARLGLLGNFIGMLTDSRSFLSYTRHELFRRLMCNLIGSWVENGQYPNDDKALKQDRRGHQLLQRQALLQPVIYGSFLPSFLERNEPKETCKQ